MAAKRSRAPLTTVALIVLGAGLVFAFWPRPLAVDMGEVIRGPMEMTINEEGRTRAHDTYVVSTPVAGRLLRVDVEPGDAVTGGVSVVAHMLPAPPTVLDARTRQEALAAVSAAEAALRQSQGELNKAIADKEFAEKELSRVRRLRIGNSASEAELDRVIREAALASASLATAEATISIRQAELAGARARLIGFNDAGPGHASNDGPKGTISVEAPITGRVLRIIQQSETTLPAGAPILEIGNITNDLEVIVELLSTDAVKVSPRDPVRIVDWGGAEVLHGVVERVEPWGFTKYSALGVEEQRVNTIIRFTDTRPRDEGLGHGFRVEARIVVWSDPNALIVPSSALFREGPDWAVLVVEEGEARPRRVEIGHNNGLQAELRGGLKEGDRVVLYPSAEVRPGTKVARREVK